MLFFDVTRPESLDGAQAWLKELQANTEPCSVVCLVGNKADMKNRRKLSYEEGKRFALENGIPIYYETSSLWCKDHEGGNEKGIEAVLHSMISVIRDRLSDFPASMRIPTEMLTQSVNLETHGYYKNTNPRINFCC
eukprot:GHVR01026254.1.p1 GENE.GHVR01026254.1~~GHVR01026254.1.p1  ORF type:complete len:136 (+),score=3.23 GHVR01026254.1:287-694(+)